MRKLSPEVPVHIKAWLFPLLARAADGRAGQTLDSVFFSLIRRASLSPTGHSVGLVCFSEALWESNLSVKHPAFLSEWSFRKERESEMMVSRCNERRHASPSMTCDGKSYSFKSRTSIPASIQTLTISSQIDALHCLIFAPFTDILLQSLSNHHLFK